MAAKRPAMVAVSAALAATLVAPLALMPTGVANTALGTIAAVALVAAFWLTRWCFVACDAFSLSRWRYGDMQAFVRRPREAGCREVELADAADGTLPTRAESKRRLLGGSAILRGVKWARQGAGAPPGTRGRWARTSGDGMAGRFPRLCRHSRRHPRRPVCRDAPSSPTAVSPGPLAGQEARLCVSGQGRRADYGQEAGFCVPCDAPGSRETQINH